MDDVEFFEIQKAARRRRMTTSEWARQALREARRLEPRGDTKRKLDIVREAVAHEFPTADIDRMLSEIEQGYARRSDE
jgi:hypothetical protein